jgi:hypothetical protein
MNKKATIVISLVEESKEKTNQELEKEIYKALSEMPMENSMDEKSRKSQGNRLIQTLPLEKTLATTL